MSALALFALSAPMVARAGPGDGPQSHGSGGSAWKIIAQPSMYRGGPIQIQLSGGGSNIEARISIYDATGRLIHRLRPSPYGGTADTMIPWDGSDDSGRAIPRGGWYFIELEGSGAGTASGRIAGCRLLALR